MIRLAAVTALGGIESEGAVTGLIAALKDAETSITQEAAAASSGRAAPPWRRRSSARTSR